MNTASVAALTRWYGDIANQHFTYDPERSRLLVRVVRALAQGKPVPPTQADAFAAEQGMELEDARDFLRSVTERDDRDQIVGAVPGLSLNEHPHRFVVDGVRLSTWCAADTLQLPAVLGRTAEVESSSPASGQAIHLWVSPRGVEAVEPAGTVISVAVVEPATFRTCTVDTILSTFCNNIFFLASHAEAERWAADRADLAILTLDEVYQISRPFVSNLLAATTDHDIIKEVSA